MKMFFPHVRVNIIRGLWAIIPIFLSFLAIQLLYVLIDRQVMVFLGKFIAVRQIPGLGLLLVLISLYLIGMIVSNVVGRRFFHFIESVSQRIPVIKAIYQVGKQLSQSLGSGDEKQAFKKILLVDCNGNGVWGIGFVAGRMVDQRTGESLYRIFMPTIPNPTTGLIFLVKESATIDPGWTIEEAVKMILSAAIISPGEIKKQQN